MKKLSILVGVILLVGMVFSCSSGHKRYHEQELPPPHSFNAHFPDMDQDSDDLVSWGEFEAYFPDSERKVFDAIDMNKDGFLDHDEWHAFKEAHGLKHKGGGAYHKQ